MNFTERFLTLCQNAQDNGMTTLSHLRALAFLTQHPEGLPMGKLADLLGFTSSAITSMIDTLERARLVVRKHSDRDRRSIGIRITHEGEVLIHDILS